MKVVDHIRFYWDIFSFRLFVVLCFVFFSGLLESFGLMLFIPVLQLGLFQNVSDHSGEIGFHEHLVLTILKVTGVDDSVRGIMLLMLIFFCLKGAFILVFHSYSSYLKGDLLMQLRSRAFKGVVSVNLLWFFNEPTGFYVNICNEQPARVSSAFMGLLRFMSNIILSCIFVFMCFLLSPTFFFASVLVGFVVIVFYKGLNKTVSALSKVISIETGRLSASIIQTLRSLKYLRATAQVEEAFVKARRQNALIREASVKIGIFKGLTLASREPLAIAVIGLVLVVEIEYFSSPIAPLLVSIVLLHRAITSLTNAQVDYVSFAEFSGAVTVFNEAVADLELHTREFGDVPLSDFVPSVEFRDVNFRYQGGRDSFALKALSFNIDAYKSVAIIGPSGGGKSTILDLVSRSVKADSGEVLLGKVPEHRLSEVAWSRRVGYVTQESVIFDDTIGNNIAGARGFDDNSSSRQVAIEAAANSAAIHEFIMGLPDKYETMVGESGVRLSGGQRQRLFIARELFRDPAILILDEATSALDSEAELAIRETITKMHGKMTIIAVAHRLASILDFDEVIIIENGEIVESGAIAHLLEDSSSKLCSMVSLQGKKV